MSPLTPLTTICSVVSNHCRTRKYFVANP